MKGRLFAVATLLAFIVSILALVLTAPVGAQDDPTPQEDTQQGTLSIEVIPSVFTTDFGQSFSYSVLVRSTASRPEQIVIETFLDPRLDVVSVGFTNGTPLGPTDGKNGAIRAYGTAMEGAPAALHITVTLRKGEQGDDVRIHGASNNLAGDYVRKYVTIAVPAAYRVYLPVVN